MKINKGIFVLLASFIAAAMLVSLGCVISNEKNQAVYHGGISYNHEKDESNKSAATNIVNKGEKYLVREHHGKIGVFSNDGTLIKILPVAVVIMPFEEREKLKSGFFVESDEMLLKIIEDYTG